MVRMLIETRTGQHSVSHCLNVNVIVIVIVHLVARKQIYSAAMNAIGSFEYMSRSSLFVLASSDFVALFAYVKY
jgi:hypothetical protein